MKHRTQKNNSSRNQKKQSTSAKEKKIVDHPVEKSTTSKVPFILFFISTVVIGIAIFQFFIKSNVPSEIKSSSIQIKNISELCQVISKIPRVEWHPKRPFSTQLMKRGMPMILTNTVIQDWNAFKVWTLEYLKTKTPFELSGVYSNSQPVFGPLWRPKKPLGSFSEIKPRNPHNTLSMSSTKFFELMMDANKTEDTTEHSNEYLYYTGNLNSPDLGKDLQPLKFFTEGLTIEHINVWIGERGVETHLHADSWDNFFVQIRGRKHWLVMEPQHEINVHPFPFLHPSFGQAGPDLHNPDFERYPNFEHARCMEAKLEPGDMLYLPPQHWHHVIAVDSSISVNIWSKSEAQKKFDDAIQLTLKSVNHKWDDIHKRAAAIYILDKLFLRLPIENITSTTIKGPGSKIFIQQLLQIRYSAVVGDGLIPKSCSIPTKSLCPSEKTLSRKERKKLEKLIKGLIKKFSLIKANIRAIYARNYVETLAFWSAQAKYASPFLHTCWQ